MTIQKENASLFSQSNGYSKNAFRIEYIRKQTSTFFSGYIISDYQITRYNRSIANTGCNSKPFLARPRWL